METKEFHYHLIYFVANSWRLFQAGKLCTWNDFQTEDQFNATKFVDYTPSQLKKEFNEVVLPNLFQYNLPDEIKESFKVLLVNSRYNETETGYEKVEQQTLKKSAISHLDGVHFVRDGPDMDLPSTSKNVPGFQKRNSETQTVDSANIVLSKQEMECTINSLETGLNPTIHAWLSGSCSDDWELSHKQLLSPQDICGRLIKAQEQFAKNGKLPVNLLSGERLLAKVSKYSEIREKITSFLDSFFM